MNSLQIKRRIIQFDFVRSICVLWIVGFWHMQSYIEDTYKLSGFSFDFCKDFTIAVLACFTFLSGFFLKKYEFHSFIDVKTFYSKRFWRFYPLYAIAVITFCIFSFKIDTMIEALFGLSLFSDHPINTLWYFCMLIIFYIITPLVRISKNNYTFIQLLLVLAFLGLFYYLADIRMIMYFPFYFLGLNLNNKLVLTLLNRVSFLISLCVIIFLSKFDPLSPIVSLGIILSGFIMLLSLGFLFMYKSHIGNNIIAFLSYSSMCAYLFHRQIYKIFQLILQTINDGNIQMSLPISIFAIILLFLFSYTIQKVYDSFIHKFNLI